MKTLIDGLIGWPERVAKHLDGWAPLFARIVVGWVFLWSGWGKLHSLPAIIENFVGWHIPAPHILAPFVSGVEFFGGLFLLFGVLTRISAGALGVTAWVMLSFAADWRWSFAGKQSSWYPTARLFRQSGDRRWSPVVDAIAEAISKRSSPTHPNRQGQPSG